MSSLRSSSIWLRFGDGVITDTGADGAPTDAEDLGDALLVPGFVDMQINGIGDVDFSRCTVADVGRARERLWSHGVTTFLPTLISAPMESYGPALDVMREAGVDGVHLEGPFLGGAPGAHRREYLRQADPQWLGALPSVVRYVTLAPEADPGLIATKQLAASGVVASIGHSTASYDDVIAAADAGASAVTHLFNAMSGLHHREPGVVGAALDDERLTPSLIADLVHVHPAGLRLAASRKRNVALISDAIGSETQWAAARGVRVIDGAPRLEDGTLAGSVLTMDRAVANMVSIGVSVDRALEMATAIPAAVLGMHDRGTLEPGQRADVVALDPSTLAVRAVWLRGERVA
jgi:N-acetylglucosamine-6-phosphate deacetylase